MKWSVTWATIFAFLCIVQLHSGFLMRSCVKPSTSYSYVQFNCFGKLQHSHECSTQQEIPDKVQSKSNKFIDVLSGRGWNGDTIVSRKAFAKLGLNVLLAYGFVSNASYITCVILAWVSHGKAFGLSPLAPGQWKSFLLVYSGFFAANNVLRPLRFSLSLVLSPFFNAVIQWIQDKMKVSKSMATGMVVFMVNIVGSCAYLFLGLFLATKYAKVPLLP